MSLKIRWHGHATWELITDQGSILVDPFFADNPAAVVGEQEVNPEWILVTHGHADHIADCVPIAIRSGAQVIANFEIATWLGKQGVENVTGMNTGGNVTTSFGNVKMVHAIHSSSLPDGSYGGLAGGFVVQIGDKRIWIAGDTALFTDMNLIGEAGIHIAIVPIGDLYTTGLDDSVEAILLTNPQKVFPSHYNTWPPIAQDPEEWAKRVTDRTGAIPVILQPGETHEVAGDD